MRKSPFTIDTFIAAQRGVATTLPSAFSVRPMHTHIPLQADIYFSINSLFHFQFFSDFSNNCAHSAALSHGNIQQCVCRYLSAQQHCFQIEKVLLKAKNCSLKEVLLFRLFILPGMHWRKIVNTKKKLTRVTHINILYVYVYICAMSRKRRAYFMRCWTLLGCHYLQFLKSISEIFRNS